MDNKNLASNHLENIFKSTQAFIKQIEKGEGLNIPDDKKDEFKKAMKEQGTDAMIEDLKKKMKEFKESAKTMNNG